MSVNSTVVRSRSASGAGRIPVRNSSISSRIASWSPTQGRWSSPGSSTNFAPGIRVAIATLLDVRVQIAGPMKNKGRDPDGRQDVPHIDFSIHAGQGEGRARAGGHAQVRRKPAPESFVAGDAWSEVREIHVAAPVPLHQVVELLPSLGGRRPWVIGIPDPAREGSEWDQRRGPLGIGGGEQHGHAAAFGLAEDRGTL